MKNPTIISNSIPELTAMKKLLADSSEIPAVQGYKLVASKENGFQATAMNFKAGMTLNLAAQVLNGLELICPAPIAELTNKEGVIKMNSNNHDLNLEKEGFKATIKGLPIEDYPALPSMSKLKASFKIKVSRFEQLLKTSLFTISGGKNTPHPSLVGILLSWKKKEDGQFIVVCKGTDSFTAAVVNAKAVGKANGHALVPSNSVKALLLFTQYLDGDAIITVGLADQHLVVKHKDIGTVWTNIMEGSEKYPDFTKLLTFPKDEKIIVATVSLSDMEEACSHLLAVINASKNKNAQNAHFTFSEEDVQIDASSSEVGGGKAVVDLVSSDAFEPFQKGFRLALLLQTIKQLKTMSDNDIVTLHLSKNSKRPLIFRTEANKTIVMVMIMPVHIG